jgi:hypothetical protein
MSLSGVKQKVPVDHVVGFWKVLPQNIIVRSLNFGGQKGTEVDRRMEKLSRGMPFISVRRRAKTHVI